MINIEDINFHFQTFYVSNEQINSPLIPEIIRVGKKINNILSEKYQSEILISLSYGKRIITNSDESNFKNINYTDFIEIVDYNPVKKILLVIGQRKPNIYTPIHWLIHNARTDINSIIQIKKLTFPEGFSNEKNSLSINKPFQILSLTKDILKNIRNENNIIIKNNGIMFFGNRLNNLEKITYKLLRKLYED